MKQFLKYGGLGFSSMLTIALFIDLFGNGAYGILMAIAALALFEGGSIAWSHLQTQAQQGQRVITKFCMWACVLLSLASSSAQIVLSTNLWKPEGLDTGFIAILSVVAALVINVTGVFGYELLDPQRAKITKELDRQAKTKEGTDKLEDQILRTALIKADARVNDVAGLVSEALATEMRDDVITYLLAQTRGGANSSAAKAIIDQAPQRKPDELPAAQPGLFDRIKQAISPAAAQPTMATMASDGAQGKGYSGLRILEPEEAIAMAAKSKPSGPDAFALAGYTYADVSAMVDKMSREQKMRFYNPGMAALQQEIDAKLDRQGATEITHDQGVSEYKAAKRGRPAKKSG